MSFGSFGGEPKAEKNATNESIERIASAAIKYKDEYFAAGSHADAWTEMTAKYPETVLLSDDSHFDRTDGFMTSTGRFVRREEALEIAMRTDQLKGHEPHAGGLLWSEDLKKEAKE